MKKIHMLCSLFAALCLTAFTGCNDNDGDYPNVYGLITTIHATTARRSTRANGPRASRPRTTVAR